MKPPDPTKPTFIELSVVVTDGSFETKLAIPIGCSKEELDRLVTAWLAMIAEAVKIARNAKAQDAAEGGEKEG